MSYSTITPVYNGADYIGGVLDSLLNQDLPLEKIIVVDDGSSDETPVILKEYAGRHPRICAIFQENAGEAAAVNRGLQEVETEWLGIVNADDPVYRGWSKVMMDAINNGPEDLVVLYPDWDRIDPEGKIIRHQKTDDFSLTGLVAEVRCLPGPGTVFKKAALKGMARNSEFPLTSDYEMWLRLVLEGQFQRLPQNLATWRFHPAGASQARRGPAMAASLIGTVEAFFARDDLPREIRAMKNESRAMAYYCAALKKIHAPEIKGRRYLLKALSLHPIQRKDTHKLRRYAWGHMLYIFLMPISRWGASALGLEKRLKERNT